MQNRQLDVLFVNPDSAFQAYQGLCNLYSAIEPPTWALLLAQSCRAKGFGVAILDCGAEHLGLNDAVKRIIEVNSRLVCFVMYGQNPNSGTTSMIGAELLASKLKNEHPECTICFVGSHISALPKEVLALDFVDLVLLNEGVYALHSLLALDSNEDLTKIRGIGYKENGIPILNTPERVVPQDRMDTDLPGYAWDLLPYLNKPLDLYRSHFWQTGYNHEFRTPFAALYTSLGCVYKCGFCMINLLNRDDNDDGVSAADSPGMRFWSADFIIKEFEKLAGMGVKTIRICDEMFFLNRRYYKPLLEKIIERGIELRTWTYARVDTVREQDLDIFRQAGVKLLGLGIESSNQTVRKQVSKGSFKEVNIREVVKTLEKHGIDVGANYIIGLPEDNLTTMQETLDLAIELNTPNANFYNCMALPGSSLFAEARKNGMTLPDSYAGYAFLSYECQPLATKYCSAAETLEFRDKAWNTYFSRAEYLDLIQRKFGTEPRRNVEALLKVKLHRKLLGHPPPERS